VIAKLPATVKRDWCASTAGNKVGAPCQKNFAKLPATVKRDWCAITAGNKVGAFKECEIDEDCCKGTYWRIYTIAFCNSPEESAKQARLDKQLKELRKNSRG